MTLEWKDSNSEVLRQSCQPLNLDNLRLLTLSSEDDEDIDADDDPDDADNKMKWYLNRWVNQAIGAGKGWPS